MRDDLRAALRRMTRQPGSSAAIVGLLAIAIAINACVFAVAYGMLWKPLPFAGQDRLVQLAAHSDKMDMDLGWAAPYLARVATHGRQFDGVAGYQRKDVALADDAGRVTAGTTVVFAQPSLFPLLGVVAERGRLLSADDARAGAEPVAVIGADLWHARFGASPAVLERRLHLDGKSYRIVGVLPRAFAFPDRAIQVWLPLAFSEADVAVENAGSFGSLRAVARLAPGATAGAADSGMQALVRGDETLAWVADQIGLELSARPLRALWLDGREGALESMLIAALLVFGVALANVYNLALLRMLRRRQEFALLAAVGATGARRARQVVLESALLAGVATALAVVLVPLGLAVLRRFDVLPADLPQAIAADAATAAAIAAMWLLATTVLAASAAASRTRNLFEMLRQTGNGQTAGARVHGLRRALVVAQVAITLALLFGTVLLVRSSRQLLAEDIGFERAGAVVGTLRPLAGAGDVDPDAVRAALEALAADIATMPGVEAVGLATAAPFSENVTLEGFRGPRDRAGAIADLPRAYITQASAGYLRALGMPLQRGRHFTAAEAQQRAPVVIVDADLAARAFPGEDPLGRTLGVTGGAEGEMAEATIVGVVARSRQRNLATRDEYPSIYLPAAAPYAIPGIPLESVDLVVRTAQPEALADALPARIAATAPALRVTAMTTMQQRLADTIVDALRLSMLLQILSVVTVLLTAAGLYALLAHAVAMRHREFGIRQALGATARDLVADVLRQGLRLVAIAFALGLPLALGVGVLLQPRLHRLSPADPVSLAIVCALLLAVGLAANAVPAWRASRIRPMEALRTE